MQETLNSAARSHRLYDSYTCIQSYLVVASNVVLQRANELARCNTIYFFRFKLYIVWANLDPQILPHCLGSCLPETGRWWTGCS